MYRIVGVWIYLFIYFFEDGFLLFEGERKLSGPWGSGILGRWLDMDCSV